MYMYVQDLEVLSVVHNMMLGLALRCIKLHSCVIILQVNEKFYKLERVYRDCIKMTRDQTRIYSILHDAPGA